MRRRRKIVARYYFAASHLLIGCRCALFRMYDTVSSFQYATTTSTPAMKLTIAASILAQTIPRTLSTNVDSTRGILKQADDASFYQAVVAKAVNGLPGHRRAALGSKPLTRRHGRRLKENARPASSTTTRSCDPLSTDPDVGLLSCGLGYDCVAADQESSPLGGLCTAISRDLQETTCKICGDYESFVYSKVNNTAVVEGMDNIATCLDVYFAAYYYAAIDGITDDSCSALTTAVATTADCCGFICKLCGDDSYIMSDNNSNLDGTIDGVDASTCYEITFAAYVYSQITEELCPSAIELVTATGCCVGPTDCSICGDATFYEDNEVVALGGVLNTTCSELQPFLMEEECNLPAYVQACCSSSTDPPEDPAGTSGTSTTPTTAPAPSPPSSASSTRTTTTPSWSSITTTLVVSMMMSLTGATAAGALMLN